MELGSEHPVRDRRLPCCSQEAPVPPLPAPASGKSPGVAQNKSTSDLLQNLKEEAVLALARWSRPAFSHHALKVKLWERPGLPGKFLSAAGDTDSP